MAAKFLYILFLVLTLWKEEFCLAVVELSCRKERKTTYFGLGEEEGYFDTREEDRIQKFKRSPFFCCGEEREATLLVSKFSQRSLSYVGRRERFEKGGVGGGTSEENFSTIIDLFFSTATFFVRVRGQRDS